MRDGFMLNVRSNNGDTLTRSGLKVKTLVNDCRLTAREIRSCSGTAVTKPETASKSGAANLPSSQRGIPSVSLAPAGRRVGWTSYPRTFDGLCWSRKDVRAYPLGGDWADPASTNPQEPYGMAFRGSKVQPQVLERYPPYSRLALERVSTAVGGEAEGGPMSLIRNCTEYDLPQAERAFCEAYG